MSGASAAQRRAGGGREQSGDQRRQRAEARDQQRAEHRRAGEQHLRQAGEDADLRFRHAELGADRRNDRRHREDGDAQTVAGEPEQRQDKQELPERGRRGGKHDQPGSRPCFFSTGRQRVRRGTAPGPSPHRFRAVAQGRRWWPRWRARPCARQRARIRKQFLQRLAPIGHAHQILPARRILRAMPDLSMTAPTLALPASGAGRAALRVPHRLAGAAPRDLCYHAGGSAAGTLRTIKLQAGRQGRHARRSGRICHDGFTPEFRSPRGGQHRGDRVARHRAGRDQVAHDIELSESHRGPVGSVADDRQVRQRDERRQVRDRNLRAGRDRARAAGARRGRQRHGRMRPHLFGLLHRQEPGADLRRLAAVRPDRAPAQCLVHVRRRQEADRRNV